ncbi:MAG: T9SS type A sorting domain-containing protein [Saprospiraceae bacterium]|nr:T9SS type A sorting domain-containing protein [Saprospiraceae bacterium]
MKGKIYLIFLLTNIIFVNLFAQYTPLVSENKFWIYHQYYSNDKPNLTSGYLINFEGDTIINNTNYKKVWHQELSGTHPCPMGQAPCFTFDQPYRTIGKFIVGYIREDIDERKVYFKSEDGTYCNQEEYLLFDFSLSVLEELDDCTKEALGSLMDFGIIDSISNSHVFGEIRSVLHTTGFVTYIGLPYTGQVNILEGIGFEKYGLFHEYNNLSELRDFCEGSLIDCNIISSTKDAPLSSDNKISITPNPALDIIKIETTSDISNFEIIDQKGRIVISTDQKTINVSNLFSGLYYVRCIAKKNEFYFGKFLKL